MRGEPDEFLVLAPTSFGAAIREYRLNNKVTQQELATRADVHRTYLSALETGATTEAMQQILQLMRALDLEIVVRPRTFCVPS